jgi:hypothetical protein
VLQGTPAIHLKLLGVITSMTTLAIKQKLTTTLVGAICLVFGFAGAAQASTFTETSPAGGTLSSGISSVGGIVLDLVGANGTRVTSQLAASQLFKGFYNNGTPSAFNGNPGTVGIQTGFTPAVLSALGGGLQKAAIRFTLYDGDTASGNFDFQQNTLLVNGFNFGDWSDVNAQNTSATGDAAGGSGFSSGGFRDNTLDTGWFYSNNSTLLSGLFSSLSSSGEVVYKINDLSPNDNFYDFTQGIDSGLINIGTGPVVIPSSNSVPTPALLPGLVGLGLGVLRKRKTEAVA